MGQGQLRLQVEQLVAVGLAVGNGWVVWSQNWTESTPALQKADICSRSRLK